MESIRQKQVEEMVKRHFSLVLQQEAPYIFDEAFVTVTTVRMSPDLSVAKIYVSVFNTENKQAVILKMEDNHFRLRQAFAQKVRRHIRKIPELNYYLDDTLDEMYKLNELFDQLREKHQMGGEEE